MRHPSRDVRLVDDDGKPALGYGRMAIYDNITAFNKICSTGAQWLYQYHESA